MEAVVPWKALIHLIEPHYPRTSFKCGRPAYLLATMLRIHLMHHWDSLSDPAMEDALIDVSTMRLFAGIDLVSERIPDETTMIAIRHLLEKHHLGEKISQAVKAHLNERGMAMKRGTIIDATLIAAPSSPKRKDITRDLEIGQFCKCKPWNCEIHAHIGAGKHTGLIDTLESSAANISRAQFRRRAAKNCGGVGVHKCWPQGYG